MIEPIKNLNVKQEENYYLMSIIGHDHHTGQNGNIASDLTTLTAARKIVERVVVGVEF